MASQESRNEGGEEGVKDSEQTTTESTQSVNAVDNRRIGPWHQPDPNRQKLLADRLSNPALRSSRPVGDRSHTPEPHSPRSPYLNNSRASTAAGKRASYTMNSPRTFSGYSSSRRQSSPRRQPSATPHYGAVPPPRQPPLFPTSASSRKVTDEELDQIVERVKKPTLSSRGGVDLRDKDFTYIQTPRLKTLPVVPGLDRRYLGLQRVDSTQMESIVVRLTRSTSASKAKFAPNRNVYVDMAPGAHMVNGRSAQSAV